ncbi:hypothetical protein HNQ39_004364 [Armatimonas rosea]|uniref:Uncharacterized protein n=1 Tax=Armatimonas rosea TaxID=685828 RepID=A0A7W9SV08_ARMRO|nr:hypothetical protein [Armatimonas rosea]
MAGGLRVGACDDSETLPFMGAIYTRAINTLYFGTHVSPLNTKVCV